MTRELRRSCHLSIKPVPRRKTERHFLADSPHTQAQFVMMVPVLAGTNCRKAYHYQTPKSILFHGLRPNCLRFFGHVYGLSLMKTAGLPDKPERRFRGPA